MSTAICRLCLAWACALVLPFTVPSALAAQLQTSPLAGRVVDSSGSAIPGATVEVTAAGASRPVAIVFTDGDGRFGIDAVAFGTYTVTAALEGFRTGEAQVQVVSGTTATANFTLEPAIFVESVIVLGEKGPRSLKDTAASVAVFDERTLDSRPNLSVGTDLMARVPNVTTTGTNNFAPSVRGADGTGPAQGADAFLAGTRPRLNVQIDGRPASYNEVVFGDAALWDVEQVEVFRGSQSTLQGRNAVAGTMIVKTKDPTFTREAAVRVGGGNLDTRQISAAVSGPLVDKKLAYRLTLDRRTAESFADFTSYEGVENPGRFEGLTLRGKLLVTPRGPGGFSTLFTVNHSDFTAPQTENVARPFDGHTAAYPDMPVFEPRATSLVVDTKWPLAGRGGDGGASRLAYEHTLSVTGLDVTRHATPGDGNAEIDGTEVVFEPRLRFAPGSGQVQGIAGLYMFRAVQDEAIDLFGGSHFDDRITTVAAFGEATVKVRPTVDVILGGRYEQERHRRVGSGGPFTIDLDETYKVFSPKVGLSWHVSPAATVGATASRGYNAGGAGFTYDAPFVSYSYEPEFVWNYEAFVRTDLDQDRLSLTANVFVSDYRDMQLPFDLNPDPDIWAFVVRNAEAARTYGAEIGTRYVGIPGWQFFADFGLLKTEVTRYPGSGLEGTELPRAPAFTSSAGAAYRHPLGIDASADVRYSDTYFSEATNNPRGKVDPYWLVNAQVGYTISRARIAAVVGNLFDSAAPLLLDPGVTRADDTAQILKPRTVSINLQVTF